MLTSQTLITDGFIDNYTQRLKLLTISLTFQYHRKSTIIIVYSQCFYHNFLAVNKT